MNLITGGKGFLGQALQEHFKARFREEKRDPATVKGVEARWRYALYDYPERTLIWPDPWASPRARLVLEDDVEQFTNRVRHEGSLNGAAVVYHLAAVADLNVVRQDPVRAVRVNLEGTMNVAQACARVGVPLVFASTCCVYGNAGGQEGAPLDETSEPWPTEPYAWQKLFGEHILAGVKGLRYRIARLGTLYGPGMRPTLFNRIALSAIADGNTIGVDGSGGQRRRYVYVDDACAGLVAIARQGQDGHTYNVCGDEDVSVRDTVAVAMKTVGAPSADTILRPDRPGQIMHENISNAKLKALGWEPAVHYQEGMRRTWEWMRGAQPK